MKCFEQLVNSKFLGQVSEELRRAQRVLQRGDVVSLFDPPTIYASKADRRYIYDCYVEDFGLIEELYDKEDPEYNMKDVIFYIHDEPILFIYSRSKKLITEAIKYSYYVNGDIPLHTTKHTINGKVWFTTMIDTRIPFPASSPN